MNQFKCDRCNEEIRTVDDKSFINRLCYDCEIVLGERPTTFHVVCFYCGDDWAFYRTQCCWKCFAEIEPLNEMTL